MPRERKPARLWLEPEKRNPDGRLKQKSVWVIKDGDVRTSTGCGPGDRAGAEEALRHYLADRHAEAEPVRDKSAAETPIVDVVRHYAAEHGPKVARPHELGRRLETLLDWWGEKSLADVNKMSCRSYARVRGLEPAARRELEDLQAAIRLYAADGLCREHVVVTLPDKSPSRVDYLTRDDAAKLLAHLWRTREVQHGHTTARFPVRHIAMFLLVALYTGTRSRRIWTASFEPEPGRPWIDLKGGVYFRAAQGEKVSATKRADSVRIPPRLLAHLRRWRQGPLVDGERRPRRYVAEYRGRAGDPKKALSKAMVATFGEDHPFVRHSLRHTCATWLMWSGEDIGDIAAYLSMTREVLLKVYGHEHPDADRTIGEAFNSRAGRRRPRR